MHPVTAQVLDGMQQSWRARDLGRLQAAFEPDALLRAPFLAEPIRGWPAIEIFFKSMVLPILGDLEILSSVELNDQVLRGFRTRFMDREGVEQVLEGAVVYAFSPRHRVSEANFFLDEANLRLLVLRKP
jgi:hypothetical protein